MYMRQPWITKIHVIRSDVYDVRQGTMTTSAKYALTSVFEWIDLINPSLWFGMMKHSLECDCKYPQNINTGVVWERLTNIRGKTRKKNKGWEDICIVTVHPIICYNHRHIITYMPMVILLSVLTFHPTLNTININTVNGWCVFGK